MPSALREFLGRAALVEEQRRRFPDIENLPCTLSKKLEKLRDDLSAEMLRRQIRLARDPRNRRTRSRGTAAAEVGTNVLRSSRERLPPTRHSHPFS
jgi:hypothetical protein